VAFVRVSVNKKKDGYDTVIWIAPADGSEPPRSFTSGQDSNPRWSPDGSELAFNRSLEKDGKPQPSQLWVISLRGGEARALTDLPKGAGAAAWSPDGKTLAFTSTTSDKDLAKKDAKPEPARTRSAKADRARDHRARLPLQRPGYLDPTRPSHVWAVGRDRGGRPKPRRVTSGLRRGQRVVVARRPAHLLHVQPRQGAYYAEQDANVYSVPRGRRSREGRRHRRRDRRLRALPDGQRIALVGSLNGKPDALLRPARPVRGRRRDPRPWRRTSPRPTTTTSTAERPATSARLAARRLGPVWAKDALVVKAAEKVASACGGWTSPRRRSSRHERRRGGDVVYGDGRRARFAMVVSTPTRSATSTSLDAASGQRRAAHALQRRALCRSSS
jgi:dipeptidyl aminopeptidase/acylaminoacyl peptidase